jgi:hypothetical protein
MIQAFDMHQNTPTKELSYKPKYTKTTLNLLMIASVAILWLSFIYVNPLMDNLSTSSMQFLIMLVPIFYAKLNAKLIKAEDPCFSIMTPHVIILGFLYFLHFFYVCYHFITKL